MNPSAKIFASGQNRSLRAIWAGMVLLLICFAGPAQAENGDVIDIVLHAPAKENDASSGNGSAANESQRIRFFVEIADTEQERRIGLMLRNSLAPDTGMLFDFKTTQPVSRWMKDTYLALDMFFIRADGLIVFIAENRAPLSETVISSPEPVRAVLELAAGTAQKYGITEGDLVLHPIFGHNAG